MNTEQIELPLESANPDSNKPIEYFSSDQWEYRNLQFTNNYEFLYKQANFDSATHQKYAILESPLLITPDGALLIQEQAEQIKDAAILKNTLFDVQIRLYVLPTFRDYLTTQSKSQLESLERSLVKDGCQDELKVRGDGLVVDGMTRIRLCHQNNIPYNFRVVPVGYSEDSVKDWMNKWQYSRRNLVYNAKEIQYYLIGSKQLKKGTPEWEQAKAIASENNIGCSDSAMYEYRHFAKAVDFLGDRYGLKIRNAYLENKIRTDIYSLMWWYFAQQSTSKRVDPEASLITKIDSQEADDLLKLLFTGWSFKSALRFILYMYDSTEKAKNRPYWITQIDKIGAKIKPLRILQSYQEVTNEQEQQIWHFTTHAIVKGKNWEQIKEDYGEIPDELNEEHWEKEYVDRIPLEKLMIFEEPINSDPSISETIETDGYKHYPQGIPHPAPFNPKSVKPQYTINVGTNDADADIGAIKIEVVNIPEEDSISTDKEAVKINKNNVKRGENHFTNPPEVDRLKKVKITKIVEIEESIHVLQLRQNYPDLIIAQPLGGYKTLPVSYDPSEIADLIKSDIQFWEKFGILVKS